MKRTFLKNGVFIWGLALALGFLYLYGCGEGGGEENTGIPSPESPSSESAPDNQLDAEFLTTNPDLVVTSPSVSNSGPAVGTKFTLSVTVRNDGDGVSGVTTLRYYRSTDTTITTSDTEVGTDTVTGLTASGSASESVEVTAQSTPGAYYYGACVDAVEEESDTTNNCSSSVEVNVPEPQDQPQDQPQGNPDLVVISPSVSDSGPTAGTKFTLSATVRNDGDGASEATTLRYYQSTDATITTSDTEVGTDAVAGLGDSGNTSESVDLTVPSDPGTYYYGACVDTVENESDTTNNCSSSVQINVPEPQDQLQGSPDLTILAVSVATSPGGTYPGGSFTFSATVRNDGDGASEATTLRYYQSTDATITTSNTEVGTDAVAGLGDSGNTSESVDLTVPSDPGTYYYGACVDAVEDESDTTNNCSSSVQINVLEPQDQLEGSPDLTILAVLVATSPWGTYPGGSFTFSATVRNDGDGASEDMTLRYYRSTDARITTSDTEVDTDAVAGLEDSESANESVVLTAPSDPGTYYYGACVDAVEDESDTTNNCSSSVQVDVRGYPDLAVGSPSVSDSYPTAGTTLTLSATVRNNGNGDSEVTTLRYYQSTDATITTSDTEVGTDAVAGLEASESANESVVLTVPSDPGTYYYGACVDTVENESDTTNNCSSSVQVDVRGYPDLAVGSPSVSDSYPTAGTTLTLSATVRNNGNGDSAATTLRYYQSTDSTIATSDTEVGTDAVAALAAAGTSAESISLTVPATAGTYYCGACVDAVEDESDTINNNCSSSVTVTVLVYVQQIQGQPDLEVGTPTVDNTSPETEASITLSATVSNTGNAESPATTLRYYQSTDTTITTSDTEVGTDAVAALAAAGTSAESISLTVPATAGAYYYGACVDAVTDESDATDNCSASVKVDVLTPQTTLTLTAIQEPLFQDPSTLEVSPNSVNLAVGGTATLSATIKDANGHSIQVDQGDGRGGFVVYWETGDSAVATVDGATASIGGTTTVTGVAAGTATITGGWNGFSISGTATVTVMDDN